MKTREAIRMRFSRHGGIYRSDVFNSSFKPGPAYRFPAGPGPVHKARRKKTRLPIVATSSGRLFLDRVGRHQSPSPLHRHSQFNMHFSQAPAKGYISTLPAGGHFYFALTRSITPLLSSSEGNKIIASLKRSSHSCLSTESRTGGTLSA
jgi:hypothetical protein